MKAIFAIKMPCVVLLRDSPEIIVVKSVWCKSTNEADTINFGNRPSELVKVFYSPNKKDKPDFNLQEPDTFDNTIAACYFGFILDNFGKINHSK